MQCWVPGHIVHVVVGGRMLMGGATQVWDVQRMALHPANHSGTDSKQPCHLGSASAKVMQVIGGERYGCLICP